MLVLPNSCLKSDENWQGGASIGFKFHFCLEDFFSFVHQRSFSLNWLSLSGV